MSEALFGLIGVIVGSLLTGGFQVLLRRRDERRGARSAARVIYAEAVFARDMLEAAIEHDEWRSLRVLDPVIDRWKALRDEYATGVNGWDFHVVAGGMAALEHLHVVRTNGVRLGCEDEGFDLVRERLSDDLRLLNRALGELWRAGMTRRERRHLMWKVGRLPPGATEAA
jgi:hypothetical protein